MNAEQMKRMDLSSRGEWGSMEHMLYLMNRYDKERKKWEDWTADVIVIGKKNVNEAISHYRRHRHDLQRLIRWNNEHYDHDFSVISDYLRLTEAVS